jgi:hypothetical protein
MFGLSAPELAYIQFGFTISFPATTIGCRQAVFRREEMPDTAAFQNEAAIQGTHEELRR